MLKVSKLTKRILSKEILKDINFEINNGEIAIFLGDSGAGKSSLLRVLNKLEQPDGGDMLLNGMPLTEHSIGMVFQNFNLFEHLSVEENITLALRKAQKKTPKEAKEIAHRLLECYELLGKSKENVQKLSGGQKQRLAIARALSLNPEIICFDEPTSALDPRLTRQVANFIKGFAAENRIVLLTTHNTALLRLIDNAKIFLIREGTIAESCDSKTYYENPHAYPLIHHFVTGE